MTNDTLSTPKLSTPRHANQYGSFGQGEEEEHQFGSIDEEAAFYRNKYRHAADLLDETRNELDEFQTSSRELEEELEKELAATEKHQAEFQDRIAKLEVEKEEWKTKHVALQKTHSSTTAAMQREMDNLRRERDKTLVALRDLEVGNDELERHGRVAASSLLDMESKLNRAIEDKTLLEQEVVIKGELEDQIQRLKTDLRDSADQVSILKDQLARATFPTPPSSVSVPISPSQSSSHLSEPDIVSTGHSARPPLSGEGSPLPPAVPPKSPLTLSGSRTASLNMSPNTAKRLASGIPSPSMSRAVSSRNLSGSAATSPTIRRTASTIGNGRPSAPAPPPAASKGLGANARTKLAALRSRLKATDDRLGNQMGPRVVSGASDGASRKVSSASVVSAASISALSVASTSAIHTRVTELADKRAGGNGYKTPEAPAGVLSPTGWVLADPDVTPGAFDSGDDTPLAHKLGVSIRPSDPDSPLVNARPGSRATSTTTAGSSRTARLPSRTAVPSPLMNMAAASAARMRESTKDGDKSRPPVSSALSRSNVLAAALQADPNAGYDLESSTRPAGRMRSVTASTASGAPSETSDRAPSRASTVLSRSTRAPSRNSAASPSFDEYTSADRSEPPPIPISGERHTLSRSVRAPSRSGASGGGGTPVPRPSSRVSATGSSRPLSPAAGATSGLPRSAYPLINSTTAGIGRSPGPGMTRSSTVSFNALAEQLSAKRGTEAYARIGQPDSRPTSRATGAVSSGSASSAAVPAAAVGAGRDRRVSHGRSQSTMASLGRGAPPVPSIPSSSTAGQMTRSGLTSSTSTRRLADRPTIASANRTTPPATASDDLRKSVRAGVSATRSTRASTLNPQSQGQGPGVSGDEDEGDDADTTLTGIPRFGQGSVLGTSTSTRTPRESPGTGNKRPMSMQHYGTPPEMPQLPGGLGPGVRSAQR